MSPEPHDDAGSTALGLFGCVIVVAGIALIVAALVTLATS